MKTSITKEGAEARVRKITKSLSVISEQLCDLQVDFDYLKNHEMGETIDEIDPNSLIRGILRIINIINYHLTINYYDVAISYYINV